MNTELLMTDTGPASYSAGIANSLPIDDTAQGLLVLKEELRVEINRWESAIAGVLACLDEMATLQYNPALIPADRFDSATREIEAAQHRLEVTFAALEPPLVLARSRGAEAILTDAFQMVRAARHYLTHAADRRQQWEAAMAGRKRQAADIVAQAEAGLAAAHVEAQRLLKEAV